MHILHTNTNQLIEFILAIPSILWTIDSFNLAVKCRNIYLILFHLLDNINTCLVYLRLWMIVTFTLLDLRALMIISYWASLSDLVIYRNILQPIYLVFCLELPTYCSNNTLDRDGRMVGFIVNNSNQIFNRFRLFSWIYGLLSLTMLSSLIPYWHSTFSKSYLFWTILINSLIPSNLSLNCLPSSFSSRGRLYLQSTYYCSTYYSILVIIIIFEL